VKSIYLSLAAATLLALSGVAAAGNNNEGGCIGNCPTTNNYDVDVHNQGGRGGDAEANARARALAIAKQQQAQRQAQEQKQLQLQLQQANANNEGVKQKPSVVVEGDKVYAPSDRPSASAPGLSASATAPCWVIPSGSFGNGFFSFGAAVPIYDKKCGNGVDMAQLDFLAKLPKGHPSISFACENSEAAKKHLPACLEKAKTAAAPREVVAPGRVIVSENTASDDPYADFFSK